MKRLDRFPLALVYVSRVRFFFLLTYCQKKRSVVASIVRTGPSALQSLRTPRAVSAAVPAVPVDSMGFEIDTVRDSGFIPRLRAHAYRAARDAAINYMPQIVDTGLTVFNNGRKRVLGGVSAFADEFSNGHVFREIPHPLRRVRNYDALARLNRLPVEPSMTPVIDSLGGYVDDPDD